MPRRYWFPKAYADWVARFRVPSGFLLVVTFALFSQPDDHSLLMGVPVSLAGLALRAWASGHLLKDQRLAETGPYAFTRNPLYLGTLLVAAGLVIDGRSMILAIVFTLVFLFVYMPVIELEEQHLSEIFAEYEAYARRVPRLIGIPRGAPNAQYRFSIGGYRANREYQALLGFLLGLAFLVAKWLWFAPTAA
jgi:protein-S-isoprenylcysteine O-methyltransferase Ste14